MKKLDFVIVITLSLIVSSCATIGARTRGEEVRPYAGIRNNAHYLKNPKKADQPALQPLNIIDMPFSFVADTLLLPYDLLKRKKNKLE